MYKFCKVKHIKQKFPTGVPVKIDSALHETTKILNVPTRNPDKKVFQSI